MGQRLKILVVDDEENARVMLQHMASYMGHEAVLARNGLEAVQLFKSEEPDIVLMDVMMPELDGFQATARIRQIQGEKWVPVVYLSALPQSGNLMKGLDAGGDDYLVKPVNMTELRAKIRALQRVAMMQRHLAAKRAELEYYYRQAEEEARIGSHLMASLTNMAGLRDDALRYWSRPVRRFSGDLVAAARTPGNVLHLMVADAVGHGLPAALNVLPLADTFYSMTAEGFSLARIVEALNRKIANLLPVDRFVAATLVSVDAYKKEIQVWNGGNPLPLFVSASGKVREFGTTRQLPLGLLRDPDIEVQVDVLVYPGPGQLVIFTDGLCEAQDAGGSYWGSAGISRAMADAPMQQRFQQLVDGFSRHVGEGPLQDDASFMLVDLSCISTQLAHRHADAVGAAHADTESKAGWKVKFHLGVRELKALDTIPFLTSVVEKLESSREHRRQIFIILSELFNNAVEHGLLHLESATKSSFDGFERYMRERKERLSKLQDGCIDVALERTEIEGKPAIRIHIKDSGKGFDHKAVNAQDPEPDIKLYGRGIMLVNSLCHSLQFLGDGNEVISYYCL
ncbi:fused response regulator/phosphatase [Noviherbaspirillum sp.]|jgi:CheY-like chemotaxis protein/anti-sigma regulatory factor (Ser/Thr protein kinase)|uniref:ATP-binding SpoIIE family protein phosphatase n=1 Tax=Noviherbaspirillum sp. TaxID=1926288 RepID=UPI0025D8FE89|nr:fused response regulator/phosphatase [Noviherbaspirillum sp.]